MKLATVLFSGSVAAVAIARAGLAGCGATAPSLCSKQRLHTRAAQDAVQCFSFEAFDRGECGSKF